jgi:hypothetical protein
MYFRKTPVSAFQHAYLVLERKKMPDCVLKSGTGSGVGSFFFPAPADRMRDSPAFPHPKIREI